MRIWQLTDNFRFESLSRAEYAPPPLDTRNFPPEQAAPGRAAEFRRLTRPQILQPQSRCYAPGAKTASGAEGACLFVQRATSFGTGVFRSGVPRGGNKPAGHAYAESKGVRRSMMALALSRDAHSFSAARFRFFIAYKKFFSFLPCGQSSHRESCRGIWFYQSAPCL